MRDRLQRAFIVLRGTRHERCCRVPQQESGRTVTARIVEALSPQSKRAGSPRLFHYSGGLRCPFSGACGDRRLSRRAPLLASADWTLALATTYAPLGHERPSCVFVTSLTQGRDAGHVILRLIRADPLRCMRAFQWYEEIR